MASVKNSPSARHSKRGSLLSTVRRYTESRPQPPLFTERPSSIDINSIVPTLKPAGRNVESANLALRPAGSGDRPKSVRGCGMGRGKPAQSEPMHREPGHRMHKSPKLSVKETLCNEVYVSGIPHAISEDELRKKFSAAGQVTRVSIITPFLGAKTVFGFIAFSKPTEEVAAIKMFNRAICWNSRLTVESSFSSWLKHNHGGGTKGSLYPQNPFAASSSEGDYPQEGRWTPPGTVSNKPPFRFQSPRPHSSPSPSKPETTPDSTLICQPLCQSSRFPSPASRELPAEDAKPPTSAERGLTKGLVKDGLLSPALAFSKSPDSKAKDTRPLDSSQTKSLVADGLFSSHSPTLAGNGYPGSKVEPTDSIQGEVVGGPHRKSPFKASSASTTDYGYSQIESDKRYSMPSPLTVVREKTSKSPNEKTEQLFPRVPSELQGISLKPFPGASHAVYPERPFTAPDSMPVLEINDHPVSKRPASEKSQRKPLSAGRGNTLLRLLNQRHKTPPPIVPATSCDTEADWQNNPSPKSDTPPPLYVPRASIDSQQVYKTVFTCSLNIEASTVSESSIESEMSFLKDPEINVSTSNDNEASTPVLESTNVTSIPPNDRAETSITMDHDLLAGETPIESTPLPLASEGASLPTSSPIEVASSEVPDFTSTETVVYENPDQPMSVVDISANGVSGETNSTLTPKEAEPSSLISPLASTEAKLTPLGSKADTPLLSSTLEFLAEENSSSPDRGLTFEDMLSIDVSSDVVLTQDDNTLSPLSSSSSLCESVVGSILEESIPNEPPIVEDTLVFADGDGLHPTVEPLPLTSSLGTYDAVNVSEEYSSPNGVLTAEDSFTTDDSFLTEDDNNDFPVLDTSDLLTLPAELFKLSDLSLKADSFTSGTTQSQATEEDDGSLVQVHGSSSCANSATANGDDFSVDCINSVSSTAAAVHTTPFDVYTKQEDSGYLAPKNNDETTTVVCRHHSVNNERAFSDDNSSATLEHTWSDSESARLRSDQCANEIGLQAPLKNEAFDSKESGETSSVQSEESYPATSSEGRQIDTIDCSGMLVVSEMFPQSKSDWEIGGEGTKVVTPLQDNDSDPGFELESANPVHPEEQNRVHTKGDHPVFVAVISGVEKSTAPKAEDVMNTVQSEASNPDLSKVVAIDPYSDFDFQEDYLTGDANYSLASANEQAGVSAIITEESTSMTVTEDGEVSFELMTTCQEEMVSLVNDKDAEDDDHLSARPQRNDMSIDDPVTSIQTPQSQGAVSDVEQCDLVPHEENNSILSSSQPLVEEDHLSDTRESSEAQAQVTQGSSELPVDGGVAAADKQAVRMVGRSAEEVEESIATYQRNTRRWQTELKKLSTKIIAMERELENRHTERAQSEFGAIQELTDDIRMELDTIRRLESQYVINEKSAEISAQQREQCLETIQEDHQGDKASLMEIELAIENENVKAKLELTKRKFKILQLKGQLYTALDLL